MKSSETNHNQIHVTISMPDGRPLGIWINSLDELDEEIERIHKRWYELEQKEKL